jgi:hypothetical protein
MTIYIIRNPILWLGISAYGGRFFVSLFFEGRCSTDWKSFTHPLYFSKISSMLENSCISSVTKRYKFKNELHILTQPLVSIEPEHIIIVELHLLLRICDKLLRNLILDTKTLEWQKCRSWWEVRFLRTAYWENKRMWRFVLHLDKKRYSRWIGLVD